MKKLLLISLLSAFALAGFSRGDLENQFYLRGGIARPTWKYGFAEKKDDWKGSDDKYPKRGGFAFELGSIFMLNSIDFADNMRIGINADYLSIYDVKFIDRDSKNRYNTFFFGSKVGPSFSYSPVDNLVLDAFVKFHPVWFALETYRGNDESIFDAMADYGFDRTLLGLKSSYGFNVRYSIAMLSFDFSPGRMRSFYVDPDDGVESEPSQNDDNENPRYNTYSIMLGLSF